MDPFSWNHHNLLDPVPLSTGRFDEADKKALTIQIDGEL